MTTWQQQAEQKVLYEARMRNLEMHKPWFHRPKGPEQALPDTHKITIPGLKFVAFTKDRAGADKLAKDLAKTYIPSRPGYARRQKCVPVIARYVEEEN